VAFHSRWLLKKNSAALDRESPPNRPAKPVNAVAVERPPRNSNAILTMHANKVNPILWLAAFGAVVAARAVATGQIAERRWSRKEVAEELGLSLVSQWEWVQKKKLECVRVGTRLYYTSAQLREAGLL